MEEEADEADEDEGAGRAEQRPVRLAEAAQLQRLEREREEVAEDHEAVELAPAVEEVGVRAGEEAARRDLGRHLGAEDERGHQVGCVRQVPTRCRS